MSKPSKKAPKDIVKPVVDFGPDAKQNALVELFQQETPPELKSVGYAKVPGTNRFVSYIIISKGTEVLSIEVSEPDLRAIAEDDAKINFVNSFMVTEE